MPTKIIREPEHIEAVATLLRGVNKLPITVTWSQGDPRSGQQNRLSHRWYADIARHRGDVTVQEVRAECKLIFGVPILRAENEAFRLSYDGILKSHRYEAKLKAIEVFDLPVTRIMTKDQMVEYMSAIQRHWISAGAYLTDPEAMKYEVEFK